MKTKTYHLINATSLRTCVALNGKQTSVRFAGGSIDGSGRIIRPGILVTSDPELQKALEADSLYNKAFVLAQDDEPQDADPEKGEVSNDNNGKEQVVGVTNAQAAIEWLKTNKAFEFKERPKADAVKAKAAELGVVFVDWK